MPRTPLYTLNWSQDHAWYELFSLGQVLRSFAPGDEEAWQVWLLAHDSFAFQGREGRLNVYKEARPRGGPYWYAYHAVKNRTYKRYLGPTVRVSLVRLEETAQALSREPMPPALAVSHTRQQIEQQTLLLSTRLSPPWLPSSLVVRERLLTELEAALCTPLTLLSASAGWGKTTLLSTWARRHPQQVAWLSLDSQDNDPARFWAAVVEALRTCAPGVGATALAMIHSPQPPPHFAISTMLLNDLAEGKKPADPLVLLLDDYQVIDDPLIHETVAFWVEHLPPQVHLLLSSRVDPNLPLPRWRLRGQLLEIRMADLRFHREEAVLLLRQAMRVSLSEEEVTALEKRTEGWVAGLQVAALSLRTQQDRSTWIATFAGSHRYLLDYIQQEILRLLPEPIRRFLLRVAVLTHLNAAVCQAVTALPSQQQAQKMLEEAERANLFLIPLDEQRQWYRFHDLFREALLVQLRASQPDLLPQLHQRAASFYEALGEVREAITHALAATDSATAARLIEREAPTLWLHGEAQTVSRWIIALPDHILWQHAHLALTATLHLLESLHSVTGAVYRQTQVQVEQTSARLETLLLAQEERADSASGGEDQKAAELGVIRRRLRLLRALIETRTLLIRGDKEQLASLAQEVEILGQDEEIRWKMIPLSLTFWLVESFQREGALLIPWLLAAKQQAQREGDWLVRVRVAEWLALAYLRAGRWRDVERECLAGLALMEQSGGQTAWAGYLQYVLFYAYYAWNRLDEARDAIRQTLHIAQDWQQVDLLILGHLDKARIAWTQGNPAAADQALQQAELLTRQERFAPHSFRVAGMRARYWLAVGDLEAAGRWAEQVAFSHTTWDPNQKEALLAQIRVSLAQQHYHLALERLAQFREQLDRPGDEYVAIEFLACSFVALHHAGKRAQARTVATRLLAMTATEENIRVFLDLGTPMKQGLLTLLTVPHEQAAQLPTSSRSFVKKLLAAFEQEEQGRTPPLTKSLPSPERAFAANRSSASPTPIGPFTRRELEVLQWLAKGATNQEIATALVIQPSTVKKHVSNLLSKLGASSRTQAVARARTFSLL